MAETEHTKTPWLPVFGDMPEDVGGGTYLRHYAGPDGKIISLVGFALAGGTDTGEAEANAAYIVKAVNSHDALVYALGALAEAARNACDARQHSQLIEALFDADRALTLSQGE